MTIRSDAERDADGILDELWDDHLDGRLPIDPVRIARRLGIDVLNARLDPDVSGALVKELGQDPVIVLNWHDSNNRKRFTCAHEIGHFVKRSDKPDDYEYVDRRDTFSASGQDPDEVHANTFAACLLMPANHVRRLRRRGLSDVEMAVRFDVSREAMQYLRCSPRPAPQSRRGIRGFQSLATAGAPQDTIMPLI